MSRVAIVLFLTTMANIWQPDFASINSSNPFAFSSDSTRDLSLAMFSGSSSVLASSAIQAPPQVCDYIFSQYGDFPPSR